MFLFQQVIFNEHTCNDVINLVDNWEEAGLYVRKNSTEYTLLINPKLRKSKRSEVTIYSDNLIFKNINLALNSIGFDIKTDKLSGAILKYDEGDFLYKHNDLTDHNNTRMICCVVQLSNWDQYEGGEFILNTEHGDIVASKEQGTLLVFKPEVYHETKPIISGTRYSLVIWGLSEDVKPFKRTNLI